MFPVPECPQNKNPRSIFQCATRPDEITHLSCWLMNDVAKILQVGSTTKAWLCGYACHVLFWASKLAKCDKLCHHMLTMHQVSSRREPSHKFKTKEPNHEDISQYPADEKDEKIPRTSLDLGPKQSKVVNDNDDSQDSELTLPLTSQRWYFFTGLLAPLCSNSYIVSTFA